MNRKKSLHCISAGLFCIALQAAAQINVLTANYDNRRANVNQFETVLTPSKMRTGQFGKLGSFPVVGQIYAQPLYVGAVQIAGAPKNVVYVATMHNYVYAIDAENPNSTSALWEVQLGDSVPSSTFAPFTDITPEIGILSTPVIDVMRQALYVISETFENNAPVFRLHALSLADGHEMLDGPVVIAASVPGSGAGSDNGTIRFDPYWQLQRPGLALANDTIYIAFGAHADQGPYHGWLIAYDSTNLQHQRAVFNTTPNGARGGIWQAGRAPAIDSAGNVYVASGNGDFDGASNLGGAVIKLSGSDLSVLDWFAPADWESMNAGDVDLGSTGVILAGDILLAGDKGGNLYYVNAANLGNVESDRVHFTASRAGIFQLSFWLNDQAASLYQHDWHGPLKAYRVKDDSIGDQPLTQGSVAADSLYQGMAISANAEVDAIVWETTGDRGQPGVPGTLHAFNASDLSEELWNSNLNGTDALGTFAKFAVPLIANGRVYVPTFSNQLAIYGLADDSTVTPRITSVVNSASLVQDSITPGELVTIGGLHLGPLAPAEAQLDQADRVSTDLASTEVFFDGIAAPVLATSWDRVSVVVPFGLIGDRTSLVVQFGGVTAPPVSIPMATAAPAIFSSYGAGIGQGTVLNEDESINSADNPARPGSIVALFATGLGSTTVPPLDGEIATNTLFTPAIPPAVIIGGVDSEILYAGSAPGIIVGVFQINARIPENSPSGVSIPISLKSGRAVSRFGVNVAVR